MSYLSKLLGSRRVAPSAPRSRNFNPAELFQRAYDAARRTRLDEDWQDARVDANREIYDALETVRSASREAERNNGLYRRMVGMHVNYVVGRGFTLQSQPRNGDGSLDQVASDIIERRFKKWWKGKVTLDRRMTGHQLSKHLVRHWIRDGEIFVRKFIRGGRLALQPLEADFCPVTLDDFSGMWDPAAPGERRRGNRTVNGIVLNEDGVRLWYHLALEHPGQRGYGHVTRPDTVPVAAEEVIHLYTPERAGQVRGMPIGAASMGDLRMLKGYLSAELVAARMGAARPVSIERDLEAEEEFTGDEEDSEEEAITFDGNAGGVNILPAGYTAKSMGADHPAGNFGPYVDKVTQFLASTWGVSHALLTRNLSQVNFSSMQIESQDCNRYYSDLQEYFSELVMCDIFNTWLDYELMQGVPVGTKGNLNYAKLEKFQECRFISPPFPTWDRTAVLENARAEIRLGLKSPSDVCIELTGEEIQDVLARTDEDRSLIEELFLQEIWQAIFPETIKVQSKAPARAPSELEEGDVVES
jgi:lambda family phage portal protein